MLVLDAAAVETLLPMRACIDVMEQALVALAQQASVSPLRTVIRMPKGAIAAMPAYDGASGTAGAKIVTAFPDNPMHGLPSHLGVVLLFDGTSGVPMAMLDASAITAIRTAAVSAVATKALSRDDAEVLAVIGTGVQAKAHVESIFAVRRITQTRISSRDARRGEALVADLSGRYDCEFVVAASVCDAVNEADIVCTVSNSRTPIVMGEWLAPGTHVNAVGSSLKDTRELDASAVARSRLYCDARQSMLAESGDFLMAMAEGAVDEAHIVGELGEVLIGAAPGRTSRDEITLFKSLGLGIEDLAAANYAYSRAMELGTGIRVQFGERVYLETPH